VSLGLASSAGAVVPSLARRRRLGAHAAAVAALAHLSPSRPLHGVHAPVPAELLRAVMLPRPFVIGRGGVAAGAPQLLAGVVRVGSFCTDMLRSLFAKPVRTTRRPKLQTARISKSYGRPPDVLRSAQSLALALCRNNGSSPLAVAQHSISTRAPRMS